MEKEKDNIAIVRRSFQALERLKEDKVIRGIKTVTERWGINRWNFLSLRDSIEESHARYRTAWISYLVRDYHVNPYWLLLGEGDFYQAGFNAEIVKKLQDDCKKKSATCK